MTFKKQIIFSLLFPFFFFFLTCKNEIKKNDSKQKQKRKQPHIEKLNLPEQNLSPEKIEEIKRTVKPRRFETIEDANRWLDSIDKVYGKIISEEEYQRAINSLESLKSKDN